MNQPLTKSFEAKAELKDNRLKAVVSGTGYPDRTGDVIMPGAFKNAVLRDFERNGWIDIGHGWEDLPVGFPVSAKVEGDSLVSEAEFHSTQRGQDARTVCMERMQAGKSVSLSIGFGPDYSTVKWFEKGTDLLKWAKEQGYDESQLDVAAIKRLGYCRAIPQVTELYEWSIVAIGANPRAKATEVKAGPTEAEYREALTQENDLPSPASEADEASPLSTDEANRQSALLRRAKLLPRA